jgi:EmrB/QacA subfamily drug resistance transporter
MTQEPQAAGMSRETRLTMIGIFLGMFLAALDQTIVSTALPAIVEDLKGLDLLAWVTTSYLLSSTVAAPIFGRLTEIYSRKAILLVAIVVFLGGSALCGLAQSMPQLIAFRAVQGIGGGALFALAFTTIAVLFPPRERGKAGGAFGAVFGLSSAIGPWLGGLLTDQISWHWVFYINMPIGLVALWFISRFMPRLNPDSRQPFDYLGAGLLMVWTIPLMLAFSWGGSAYPWISVQVLGLFALALVGLVFWVWLQSRIQYPLFDLSVLKIRTFTLSALAGFFFGPAFLGAVAFLPLYLQIVKGVSASASGITVLPLTLGVIIGAVGSGVLSGRTGRYKGLLVGGSIWLLAVLLTLHFVLAVDTPLWLTIVFCLLLGLGLGPAQSLLNLAAQNNVPMERIGSATAAVQFIRQIGATIGIAIMGTVLSNTLVQENCKVFPENAQCRPGAPLRSQEFQQGNLDETFKKLEDTLVAALKGDKAAYQTLISDPNLPEEQKKNLVEGGIPAQFKRLEGLAIAAAKGDTSAYQTLKADPSVPPAIKGQLVEGGIKAQVAANTAQTLASLEKALKGDTAAKQTLLANPQLPAQVKSLLQTTPPPSAVAGIVTGVQKGLEAGQPALVAQIESQAIPQIQQSLQVAQATALAVVPAQIVKNLEETKAKVKTALNNGITQAEKNIFLYGALFVMCSLVFSFLLPNEELKGSVGGRAPSH